MSQNIIIFDFEVFRYNWLVVIYDTKEKKYIEIIDDKNALEKIFNIYKESLWVGYNINHYDNSILKAILSDVNPYMVSKLIINEGRKPWEVERALKIKQLYFYSCDLMIDLLGMSLKELEAYMGMSIEETEIDFNLDRPLTDEEISMTFKYCRHDVDATYKFLGCRIGYIKSKFILMKMFNLPMKILSMTSAQIAATVLQAERIDRKEDALIYNFPSTLVLDKYTDVLPMYQKKLNYDDKYIMKVANVDHLYSFGGLHGAIPNFTYNGELWQIDATLRNMA